GTFDLLAQRLIDSLMAFPTLILGIAIVGVLGPSLTNVIAAIAFVMFPQAARVIRSAALSARRNLYIEAARAIGASNLRIMMGHLLPQCVAPFIIIASAEIGGAIVVEASLSFLGVGVPPPEPSWGGILAGAARRYAERAPWIGIFPGIAISMTVFGFNYLGDALRDILDPRLRGRPS
ncbi:MAG: ABC transporter permease, partial [Chloroflexota bacterium]